MILDELLEFADATSIAGTTGTALIGDVIDLGATPQDFGHGKAMYLVIQVTTDVAGTSSTVTFELASDATATIATNGSASTHILTDAIAEADLVPGKEYVWALPPNGGQQPYERYLGLLVTRGVATLSAGAINAFLTFDPKFWKSYADAVN